MTAAEVLTLRQRYWQQGYRPVEVWNADQTVDDNGEPLKNPGKQPRGTWVKDASRRTPKAVLTDEQDTRALNTGVLCREVHAFDVDVLDPELVDRIVALIEKTLGPTPLVRIGRAPKILLVYRPDQPFRKVQTPELFFPDGSKAKVELLADGQQFVGGGIHPDTGLPYRWTVQTPADVPIAELPVVTQAQARTIIAAAEHLLRDAGATEKKKPTQPERKTSNGHAGDFFAQVNTAALADIAGWVRLLFPKARFEPGTGAWRISSADLGRDLEEDISIHPGGIRDFGEEVPLSAIDLVMRRGSAATVVDAALWLCERLRIEATSLGYRGKTKSARAEQEHEINRKSQPNEEDAGDDFLVCKAPEPHTIASIPPRTWAYGRYLLFGSASALGGIDGAGKGAIALVMALSFITGRALLGEHVWRKGPVAIITYEDDETEWRRRIAAACIHYGIDYESVIGSFHFIWRPGFRVCLAAPSFRSNTVMFPDGDAIIRHLKHISAVLLMVDPFNHAHALEDGNSNAMVAKVAGELTRIAQESATATLVLHHLRKGATGDPDDLMGAVALRATFRSVRIIARMLAEQAKQLSLPPTQAWRYTRISGSKENYAPPPELTTWYKLESIELDNGADIYGEGDNVQVATLWQAPDTFEGLLRSKIAEIFAAVRSPPHPACVGRQIHDQARNG